MSYWISLMDGAGGEAVPCEVPSFAEGGTYAVGGTTEASLNVTYNYGECWRLVPGFEGFREQFDGKRAGETLDWLQAAVDVLGDRPYKPDYWAPTPGNAGHAAAILLGWARQYPDAVWRVS